MTPREQLIEAIARGICLESETCQNCKVTAVDALAEVVKTGSVVLMPTDARTLKDGDEFWVTGKSRVTGWIVDPVNVYVNALEGVAS